MESPAGSAGPGSATAHPPAARRSLAPRAPSGQAPPRRVVASLSLPCSIEFQLDCLDDWRPARDLVIQEPAGVLRSGIGVWLKCRLVKQLLQIAIGKARACRLRNLLDDRLGRSGRSEQGHEVLRDHVRKPRL